MVLALPDAVDRGERFMVSVQTYVDDCDDKGRTQVENREMRARIVVYSWVGVRGNCVRTQRRAHEAEVRFANAGIGNVIVVGFSESRGIVEREYTVIVYKYGMRNTRGSHNGEKPRKFNQGCTICHSCR